jgi:nitrite reductase/ring-hydroxylating ferredoxin subunit
MTDIADGTAIGFTMETAAGPRPIFIVRQGMQVHAYENRCPHTGVNLDWQPDQFLDLSNTLIQCSTHGALFRIRDGLCIYGPCLNRSLTPVAAEISDGDVYILL